MMSSNPAKPEDYTRLIWLLGIVTAVWIIFGLVSFGTKITGTFGDTYGVLNAWFSGLAFATLIYTVDLQRKELQLQREELQHTRAELRGQKEQLEQQNRTSAQQRFESTFFRMVDLHHNIVAAIEMPATARNATLSDRPALNDLGEFFRVRINANDLGPTRADRLKGLTDFYLANYHDRQHALAHYFRNLYRIMKLVDESTVSDKRVYSGIVRAQLSNSELILLFLNCLSVLGNEKFKPLVEKYAMFEHIPWDEAFLSKYGQEYNQSAYGDAAVED